MDLIWMIALGSAGVGLALGALRRATNAQPAWVDGLLLFACAKAVCDLSALWLPEGTLGLNAYTLAIGFIGAASMKRALRRPSAASRS